MVLMSQRLEGLTAAATGVLAGARPVLYCTGQASVEDLAALAEKTGAPLCVAGRLEAVAERVEALGAKGVKNMLISPGEVQPSEALTFLTQTRRAALNKKFRPLGCPVLMVACGDEGDDKKTAAALDACAYVCKYAAVIVSDAWQPYQLLPILTTRQNIYTDPQKPVQVEAKLYEIGDVANTSPLLVTTNFSLSYYAVESEVEASRIPCRILAVERADVLGGGQVQSQDDHRSAELKRRQGENAPPPSGHPRSGRRHVCAAGGRVGLGGPGGSQRGFGDRTVSQDRVEKRLT
jgi:acetyl-CoA decarbonylase/synthase complex subunit gamma